MSKSEYREQQDLRIAIIDLDSWLYTTPDSQMFDVVHSILVETYDLLLNRVLGYADCVLLRAALTNFERDLGFQSTRVSVD